VVLERTRKLTGAAGGTLIRVHLNVIMAHYLLPLQKKSAFALGLIKLLDERNKHIALQI
jgi:hypothetical protein